MKIFFLSFLFAPLFSYSQTAANYRERAQTAFKNDDPELAIKFINDAIQLKPNDCDYYVLRAIYKTTYKRNIEIYKTSLVSAIDDMTKAMALGCTNVNDYTLRGDFYTQLHLTEKARDDYQKALIILKNPTTYSDYTNRAGIKKMLQDFNGAISDYTRAIELDTACISCFRLYGLRAHCKAKTRDYVGALADYSKNLELYSFPGLETGEVYCNRGIVKLNMDNISGACDDWREASNLGYMRAFDLIKEHCR